jgi:hypothetical protein
MTGTIHDAVDATLKGKSRQTPTPKGDDVTPTAVRSRKIIGFARLNKRLASRSCSRRRNVLIGRRPAMPEKQASRKVTP